jgi:SAM-dependent methyltransferase
MTDASGMPPDKDLYLAYENWKRWDNPFTFTADENVYFEGECRGLAITGATVFEIGFGSGNFLAWAQQKGANVAGSEINPASLEGARSRGIELLPAAFENVADANASCFDTVVGFDVFEHFTLDEIVRRLAALENMVKPGGHVLLRFPNAQSPFGLAPQNGDPTHKTALSRDAFELLIQNTGFDIVRYGGSFRIGGGGALRSIVRPLRSVLRNALGRFLNFVYSNGIPYDPVVVIVLRRRLAQGET